jgi:Ca2+/H+ antiporter, TMEM165/GDT1 family
MDFKIMATTFGLIFIAELGDKTQIAAMGQAAGSKAPVSIFIGAATALILSTLIAVALGTAFNKIAEDYQFVIKGAAGLLFIVLGVLYLTTAIRAAKAQEKPRAELKPTALAHIALELAAGFEEASATEYAELAASTEEPAVRELFLALEKEERAHLAHMREFLTKPELAEHPAEHVAPEVAPPMAITDPATADALRAAIDHEHSMAEFYKALADSTPFPSVAAIFAKLADDEMDHYKKLEAFRKN